jgi:uncharacterized protein (DUF302 family)
MCWSRYVYGVLGLLVGFALLIGGGYYGARSLMVVETESPHDFEKTIELIKVEAKNLDWKVPKIYRLCDSLRKDGYDVQPVAVVELCKPEYAATLLSHDDTRLVSSFMPCRISVYERGDGSVVISRMNTGLVSRLFRGRVAEVMAVATEETQTLIDLVLGVQSGVTAKSEKLSIPSHG